MVLKKLSSRSPPARSSMIFLRETVIASRLWFCSPSGIRYCQLTIIRQQKRLTEHFLEIVLI